METGGQAPFTVSISAEELRRQKEKAGELRRTQWWKRRIARGVCYYCHKKVPPAELTMDHIVPLIREGKSTRNNIVPACKECNSRRSTCFPSSGTNMFSGYPGRLPHRAALKRSIE